MTPDPGKPALFHPPTQFTKKMQQLLGDQFPGFNSIYSQAASTALRVNTLKIDVAGFIRQSPFGLRPVDWCPQGFWLDPQPIQPGKHPYHAAGLYYLQDASAMAVVELLQPQPGERILDLAAAPGGKSTHILSRMQGQGILVANEIHPKRAMELVENLERWGATNAIITNETPQGLSGHFQAYFDRILLDAPCSGEGMFRKSEAARNDWTPALVQACSIRQEKILEEVPGMLREGGRLVYSTCTFSPEENEQVIARFLQRHPEFELAAAPAGLAFAPGRPDWAGDPGLESLKHTSRLWPHLGMGEGHFIAVLEKKDSPGQPRIKGTAPNRVYRLHQNAATVYREFSSRFLVDPVDIDSCWLSGEHLYRLPPGAPDLRGIHILRPGLWLGAFRPGRFEPSHSLAMALRDGQSVNQAGLDLETSQSYLHGQTLEKPGNAGWVLVTIDGHPLGWGKRVGSTIKNYYPKGLRWV